MSSENSKYPAQLTIDYPKKLDRVTTLLRILWSIPILIVVGLLTSSGNNGMNNAKHNSGFQFSTIGGDFTFGLLAATALLILFRQRYPRWWYDFNLELNRFTTRVGAYFLLLTDRYPSTVDAQSVHLDFVYPDAKRDLNRWMPLVKWFLAIPHYIILVFLGIAVLFVTIFAWFVILFTGRYPKNLFDFVVGVGRWGTRVNAYAVVLTTDTYPPFSLA